MTAQVTWSISDMKRNTADGGVFEVNWICRAEDDVESRCSASDAGKMKFEYDASASGFTAYDDLTEETVLGWVKAEIDAKSAAPEDGGTVMNESCAAKETRLKGKVDAQVAKLTSQANGVPWQVATPEGVPGNEEDAA